MSQPILTSFASGLLMTLACFSNVSGQSVSFSAARPGNSPASTDQPADTLSNHFAQTITAEDLERHLQVIASDEMEGRETGMEGQRKAATYIEGHFQNLGLKPLTGNSGYRQSFELKQEGWDEVYIQSADKRFVFLEDFYGWPSTNNSFYTEADGFLFLGYGIDDSLYSDYGDLDVTDKVLVIMAGEPVKEDGTYWLSGTTLRSQWTLDWRKKIELATVKGASAILIVSKMASDQLGQKSFVNYIGNPTMELSENREGSPYSNTLYLTVETAESLFGKKAGTMAKNIEKINKKFSPLSKFYPFPLTIKVEKSLNTLKSDNVLGMISGSDRSDEYIFVTAHYDHLGRKGEDIYNGADDDGSGTVSVLEIAEAMQKAKDAGFGPRRNVVFMTVSGEEKGLLGSEYYTNHPIVPLEQTVTNLNIDMVGRVDEAHKEDPFYVYTIGSDFLSTDLHDMQEEISLNFPSVKVDYLYNNTTDPNRYYYRSDHYNFAKNGVPVIFYFNGSHEDYHKTTDTIEKIRFDVMQERGRFVFNTLWLVANADKRPEVNVDPNTK